MPGGVPVATVALNGAKNAGILAAQIIATSDSCVLDKVIAYKDGLKMKKGLRTCLSVYLVQNLILDTSL